MKDSVFMMVGSLGFNSVDYRELLQCYVWCVGSDLSFRKVAGGDVGIVLERT